MKNSHKYIFLIACSAALLISLSIHAHEPGEYKMSFDNWLANHPEIKALTQSVKVKCETLRGVKGEYQDVNVGNTLHLHQPLYENGELNIGFSGWQNTFALKSGNVDIMLFHGKPLLPRQQYYADELAALFKEIIRTGTLEYIYELNSYRYRYGGFYIMRESRGVPKGFHYKVGVLNKDELSNCFEV